MQQLAGSDAIFLALETPSLLAHVGGLTVLDPAEAPGFGFERLAAVVDERIRLAPRFCQKLRELPLGLDRPYWVDDPHFDVRRHLHRIAVPSPGSMRELAELAGHLYAQPLDRRRPLWEIWYIEGVEQGCVGLLMKSHHCLMDGMAGAGLGELLCDLAPDPPPRAQPPARAQAASGAEHRAQRAGGERRPGRAGADAPPGDLALLLRGAGHWLRSPFGLAHFGARALRQGLARLASLRDPEAPPLPTAIPRVSFNAAIGRQRGFACASLPLADLKRVKDHFGVTLNDVVLALAGAAVRGYLLERGELPARSLAALIAISTRSEGDQALGNRIVGATVSWATDVADPAERLQRIHRNVRRARETLRASGLDPLGTLGELLPPGLVQLAVRAFGAPSAPFVGNAVVSNVRATPVPLYTAGARIECMYPLSLLSPGQGLNITAVSYRGRVDFGLTVDPELVPDAWRIADAIPAALAELEAAARPRQQRRHAA